MRAKVTFKIGGRTVPAGQIGRELERSLNTHISKLIDRRAGEIARKVRCPHHGHTGRVVKRGGRVFIEGCCEKVELK